MTDTGRDLKESEAMKGRRRKRSRASLFSQGEPMLWLTGGGLVIALLMIAGLLMLVLYQGMGITQFGGV